LERIAAEVCVGPFPCRGALLHLGSLRASAWIFGCTYANNARNARSAVRGRTRDAEPRASSERLTQKHQG